MYNIIFNLGAKKLHFRVSIQIKLLRKKNKVHDVAIVIINKVWG